MIFQRMNEWYLFDANQPNANLKSTKIDFCIITFLSILSFLELEGMAISFLSRVGKGVYLERKRN